MDQQRITCYSSQAWEGKSRETSHLCHFLRLPLHIRRQIYRETATFQEKHIDLNLSASVARMRVPDDSIYIFGYNPSESDVFYDDDEVTQAEDLPLKLAACLPYYP